MSKKHKKRKKSRRERKGQPQAAAPQSSVDTAASPTSEPSQPVEPTQPPPPPPGITATFKPAEATPAPAAQRAEHTPTSEEEAEYTSVRKDLRKLGVTIVVLILVIGGLTVVNDQTGFVNALGEQLFHLWE